MTVKLNGEPIELPEGATIDELVRTAGVNGAGRGVAVALDGDVVPRGTWAETEVRDGQSVEVVAAIQGG